MIIGFMRNPKRPIALAKLISLIAKPKGMEVLYFCADDVNINTNKINGFIFVGDKWRRIETEIPKIIDVSYFCLKHSKVIRHLEKHAFLTASNKNRISKEKLQYKLAEDPEFEENVIPSAACSSIHTFEQFLTRYKNIVVKPISSQRGVGVYKISVNNARKITIGYNKTSEEIAYEELEDFYNNKLKDKKHVMQKYVASSTPQGDPFDCRVHLEKNGQGKWVIAKKYIRIGIGQKIISNVNQGGGVADAKVFLKANNQPDIAKKMLTELDQLGLKLANKMEELRGVELANLGLDIGIENDGSLYVFEANTAPDISRLKAEVAMYRTDYYKYLIEHKA
ncbi:YheC/YheD family protein [Oceanobacillus locisalsi]|uniref:YheC/YheD family protein n=1 Tax=Oceanobacillus locisalsi TaxID=546107 RepID=A0ABW3NAA1_9BACI